MSAGYYENLKPRPMDEAAALREQLAERNKTIAALRGSIQILTEDNASIRSFHAKAADEGGMAALDLVKLMGPTSPPLWHAKLATIRARFLMIEAGAPAAAGKPMLRAVPK